MSDNNKNDFLFDEVGSTKKEAQSWISSLPWWVKLGAPVVAILIAIPVAIGGAGRIVNPNPGSLSPEQFRAVTEAGEKYFLAQRASYKGTTESGKLASCSSLDSDGDKRVTCTGTVPMVSKDASGEVGLTWKPGSANCDIPVKGAAGCKPK
jgi:hypothetical protein